MQDKEVERQMLVHDFRSRVASIAARIDRVLLSEDPAGQLGLLASARTALDDLVLLGERLVVQGAGDPPGTPAGGCEDVDLAELCRGAARSQETYDVRPGQHVRVVTDGAVVVRGHRTDLDFVVTNLIGNAVKYSPDGTHVAVRVRSGRGLAVVRVSDQGIGLTTEDRRRIWDPEFRSAAARALGTGSGVGLSLIKRIIEDHLGVVTVVSEVGRGTQVTVLLPLTSYQDRRVGIGPHD